MEWNFLSGVGAVFLGYYSLNFVLQVLHGIRAFFLPAIGIKKNLKKLGQWAGEWSNHVCKVQSICFSFLHANFCLGNFCELTLAVRCFVAICNSLMSNQSCVQLLPILI